MRDRFGRMRRAAVLAGVFVWLGGCPRTPDDTPPAINVATGLQAEYLVAGAAHPSAIAAAADGRIFYTEKNTGQIRVIKDGVLLDEPFARVPVNFAGD